MTTFEIKLNNADKAINFINGISKIDADADLKQSNNHAIVDAKDMMGVLCMDLTQKLVLIVHSNDESTISKVKNIVVNFGCEQRAVG